jgi:hypothetical protein
VTRTSSDRCSNSSAKRYNVERVQDRLELGFEDGEIVSYCREADRLLLTNDDDFFAFDTHPGIFFVDDQRARPREVATAIQRIERFVGPEELAGQVFHVPDGWV